jgi:hypothetical protein
MMTIKEKLNALSINEVLKPQKKETIQEIKITNHFNEAYKLDISSHAIFLLNNMEKQEIALINTDVLTYSENLQLIKKR